MSKQKRYSKITKEIIKIIGVFGICCCIYGCGSTNADEVFSVIKPVVNSSNEPVGVSTDRLDFGWQMESSERGKKQSAYRITVAASEKDLKKNIYVWDSGKVESSGSLYIPYGGETLQGASRYYWNVEVWDEDGNKAEPENISYFDTCPDVDTWEQTKWLSAPKKDMADDSLTNFNISFDLKTESDRAYFIFGADTGEYGHYYLWEMDFSQDNIIYRISEMNGKKTQNIYECQTEYESTMYIGKLLHTEVSVEGNRVETSFEEKYLDSELTTSIDVTETSDLQVTASETASLSGAYIIELTNSNGMYSKGYGVYQERNGQDTYYDNIQIKDDNGNIIVSENFDDADNTVFKPAVLDIENGMLKVKHQYIFADKEDIPAPMFRKEFEVTKEVSEAYLFGAALGIYAPFINGERIGEYYFPSGRQSFNESIKYDSFDITQYIAKGTNTFGAYLGHGWFDRAAYSGEGNTGFRAQIVICYTDGTRDIIGTDDSWKCYTNGPIRNDDMYNGEFYDAAFECDGWTSSGYDDSGWIKPECNIVADRYCTLQMEPSENEKIACVEHIKPVSVTEPVDGVYVYDFGQEFSGIVALSRLSGSVSDQNGSRCITMQYGEALNTEQLINRDDETGTVWNDNYLMAQNTDYCILDNDTDSFSPQLVCRAFRYVQITGLSKPLPLEQVDGIVLSSDLEKAGEFSCSNEDINKLYLNIVWTQKSNYLSIPTDCPQRDERFGWSGDAQVFSRSGSYNSNVYHFMDNYLYYLRQAQSDDGAYPDIVPSDKNTETAHNGWADAGITITWNHYLQYGDKNIILNNYDAMCRYIEHLVNTSEGFIRYADGYGDHNAVSETPIELTNTAQCAHSARLLSKMAAVIGKEDDASYYNDIADKYTDAWYDNFVQDDGSVECWTQAAYTLGLEYGLFKDKADMASEKLSTCIDHAEGHLNTGYIATEYILPVLADYGYTDKAYNLLEQTTYPSWLYQVQNGATTVYERWNGYSQTDGGYGLQGSLNHCGLGSVNEFLFRYVAGIDTDEEGAGFKNIILRPTVGGSLSFASGKYESPYGLIVSEWTKTDEEITYHIVIPANTTAKVYLPTIGDISRDNEMEYTESGTLLEQIEGIQKLDDGAYKFPSGEYEIKCRQR